MSIASGESPIGTALTLFLVQLIIIVVLCRLLAYLFRYIKQPSVIAEVVTGIVLGPSALGRAKGYTEHLFPPTSLSTFSVIANVGLILFMFMVGLEIDTKLMKKNVGSALIISISAMVTPFLLGLGSAYAIYTTVVDDNVSFASFLLFVGVAMSITAFPVLARILTELKMLDSRVGNVALSSAAVDDVVAWCLLALVVSIARAHGHLDALWTFLMLIGFILFMMFIVRPLLAAYAKRRPLGTRISLDFVVVVLVSIFVCAWFTEIIGVHAIFGSFILGTVIPRRNGFAHSLIERIEDLVVVLFLPLYFTYSGLRTNIGSLSDATSWGLVILVVSTACIGKIVGATVATRLLKNSWRESFTVGILMNTKGLVELIVLNVGLDVGVLNTKVFTIFVIMALITTFMTVPLLHFFYFRKLHKEAKQSSPDTYTVFLNVSNMGTSHFLVTVSSLFNNMKEHIRVKALLLVEITDRPSSYFFSEYYNMVQDRGFTKDGKKRKNLLSNMKNNAKSLGISEVETKTIASANLTRDVIEYCQTHTCDIILYELPYWFETETTPTNNSSDSSLEHELPAPIRKNSKSGLSVSIDILMDKGVGKVLKFDPHAKAIASAVQHTNSSIGVLVRKQSAVKLDTLSKILFLYHNKVHESRALKTVMSIAQNNSNIQITVLSPTDQFKGDVELPNVTYIRSEIPDVDVGEELHRGFDLVIVGSPRSVTGIFDWEVLKQTECPVLILYNEKHANSPEPTELLHV